jgi:hypothetical protein
MSQFRSHKKTTPFCSFCRDAGKTRDIYTSHYPKDRPGKYGKVVCPTILSSTCGYCRKTGHTTRYCSSKQPTNHTHVRRRPRVQTNDGWSSVSRNKPSPKQRFIKTSPSPKRSPTCRTNKFSALSDDDEEQTNTTVRSRKQVMDVNIPKVVKATPMLKGAWGKGVSAAIKEEKKFEKKPVVEKKDKFSSMASLGTDLNAIAEQAKAAREALYASPVVTSNWGDIVDSDSDYDDSEYDSYSEYGY